MAWSCIDMLMTDSSEVDKAQFTITKHSFCNLRTAEVAMSFNFFFQNIALRTNDFEIGCGLIVPHFSINNCYILNLILFNFKARLALSNVGLFQQISLSLLVKNHKNVEFALCFA